MLDYLSEMNYLMNMTEEEKQYYSGLSMPVKSLGAPRQDIKWVEEEEMVASPEYLYTIGDIKNDIL